MEPKKNDRSLWQFLLAWAEGDRPIDEEDPPVRPAKPRPPEPAKTPPKQWRLPRLLPLRTNYRLYTVLSVIAALIMGGALMAVALQLAPAGSTQAPDLNEVSQRYLEKGLEETGAVNAVAGMILDYRAFDTFGESTVLFAATMSVVFLLRSRKKRTPKAEPEPVDEILRDTGRLILPVIMLFGIYVVLNGHLSPGGGFSGGSILGAGLILASFIVGLDRVERLITPQFTTGVTVGALMVYAGLKSYSFFTGANHVGWEVPKGTPGSIFSSGFILPLNICVGLIVACTMYTFYDLFARKED